MTIRGFKVKFLYSATQYPAKYDKELINYMNKHFATSWKIYEATSLADWLSIIEQSTLLVSGRFYHTIAAACLGTPFIALNSNTPKMDGLAHILQLEKTINYSSKTIFEDYRGITCITRITRRIS